MFFTALANSVYAVLKFVAFASGHAVADHRIRRRRAFDIQRFATDDMVTTLPSPGHRGSAPSCYGWRCFRKSSSLRNGSAPSRTLRIARSTR